MKVIALRSFISAQFGNVTPGQELDISERLVGQYIDNGLVRPANAAKGEAGDQGDDTQPGNLDQTTTEQQTGSSSQADQASSDQTSKPSKGGARKRGRKIK